MKRVIDSSVKTDPTEYADASFSAAVIHWQKLHGRHALPWQKTQDAYRIWLSEIMLQQTQVSAVIPYYQRFLQRFPDVATLAAAPSEAVMAHWSGLGYYTRARNLHRCAQRIVQDYAGQFPADPVLLQELPGIGRSTAAAIAAFAYGTRAAILDGNVKRVFARVFGVDAYPGLRLVEEQLWRRAVALLPQNDIGSYTQGLMDLGATLCTRSKPQCSACPFQSRCVALATDRVSALPVRKPKKTVPEKHTAMLVITDGDLVLLEQRPDSGIWGGLLSLPEIPHLLDEESAALEDMLGDVVRRFGVARDYQRLQPFSHGFTHFKLHVAPYRVDLVRRHAVVEQGGFVWLAASEIDTAPLPAPVKKLLRAL
jgi:A/G-specific adenine glycosylase